MFTNRKSSARRAAIRGNRPDSTSVWWEEFKASGAAFSMAIAAVFYCLALGILLLRQQVLPYRPGQTVAYDIISRADFSFQDKSLQEEKQLEARDRTPRVYQSNSDKIRGDSWQPLQDLLLSLPDKVAGVTVQQLPSPLRDILDGGSVAALQRDQDSALRGRYNASVNTYVSDLRRQDWVILPAADRELEEHSRSSITLLPGNVRQDLQTTFPYPANEELKSRINGLVVEDFHLELQPKMLALTLANLAPTHIYDADATVEAQNNSADNVPSSASEIHFRKNEPIVHKGVLDLRDWQLMRAENQAFIATLGGAEWKSKAGVAIVTLLLTIALAMYVAHFQPRVIRNHARGIAIAALLLSMLLLAQLAGIGSGPVYLLAIAPTLLVGMILTIAYDARFAIGLTSMHGLLVTIGLDQRVGFLLIIWVGAITACFMLGDIRSRSKLIEVGGISAIAMMLATAAWGAITLDPWAYIADNCLYAGAAGLTVGFVVLGILPFIEKAFRITTTMTLLELADASQPLLRRLAVEAPGTYNHSLQVATLAEAAAEAIDANALLCRVGSYYHDIGKINKPDYFVENQGPGQENRHLNLSPSVSFLIIKGHVADGVEMAREYNLPHSLLAFIQQHHGTTLVEYFYHAACHQHDESGEQANVCDTEFRYPGPRPRARESGIVMLADCVESAARAMSEPTAARIETLVHELVMKRLLDGQLDECELTMSQVSKVEKSLAKMLLSIYHGRIAYPSTSATQTSPAASAATRTA